MTNDELEKLAKAATPGPWWAEKPKNGYVSISSKSHERLARVVYEMEDFTSPMQPATCAFIAAANPKRILELLDEVKRLRKALNPENHTHD